MSTPALARAYGAADRAMTTVTPPPGVDLSAWLSEHGERALIHGAAHAAVSAALHDPSVQRRVHDALYTVPADDLLDKQPGETYHDHAERIAAWAVGAVSAAILGAG